jgi:putative membrane protein
MRKISRQLILSVVSFFIISYFYPGLDFEKTEVLVIASLVFGLLGLTIKPALKLLSLPLNLFTFGLFSFFSGAVIIFIVSFFVAGFSVVGFDFPGVEISGFSIPAFYFIPVFSALLASILVSWLNTLLRWVFH